MTAVLAALRFLWPYLTCLALGIGAGWHLGAARWEGRYERLQAEGWQNRYNAEHAVAERLQSDLETAQATAKRNQGISDDTHQALAAVQSDRDHLASLLQKARPAACPHPLPQAADQPGVPATAEARGDGSLDAAIADALTEARGNVLTCTALIEQLTPQL